MAAFSVAASAQTSSIPDRPTAPIRVTSGMVLDFGGRTLDGSAITGDGLFRCFNADRITIRNVTVTNNPRYAFLGRNCTNATITNFRMTNMSGSTGGIRFDIDGDSSGLRMSGIRGDNVGGHAVEVWNANGFNIADVTANNTGSSALLLNNSRNGTVGTVTGTNNSPSAGYATFRVANGNGPNVTVSRVVSRNSARGFFSVSNSSGTTVNAVDIQGARIEGIYIQDSTNTRVVSGSARGAVNCRIRGGSGNSIGANCGGSIAN
ncbi:hypothetical protein ACG02S_08435 [Roseateles sp. DC23W]|uniref:Right handed beta helix region n=1 Tax=Pelomonas dachongensis TaxID=3299029 RepID=A0ABW7EKC1_9BURK